MILGAGYTQLPLFAAAKRLGCSTIAASIPGDYPCFSVSDKNVYVDLSDPEAVVEAARQERIDAVATCGLDLAMRAFGAVSEALQLPGPSLHAAERAANKYKMKCALKEAGVRTADFYKLSCEEDLEDALRSLSFPMMLKAVDLMGSRGIYRCDTAGEARLRFHDCLKESQQDYCLAEKFLDGVLFGAEAMVRNGNILFILPNNTETVMTTTLSPIGHSIPLENLSVLQDQITEQVSGAIRALGLDNCPVNCDLMLVDGRVYVIELTGRSGATGLSEITGAYFHTDYYEGILRLALGEDVEPLFRHGSGSCLSHTISSDKTGILRSLTWEKTEEADVLELSFNVSPGDYVQRYTNGRDRIGQVILKGTDLAQCKKRLAEILSGIQITVEQNSALRKEL